MRFKLGSQVEVMNSREVPISWRTGEILSGDRHTYTVRYDRVPLLGTTREAPAERVSKKLVRPCPPPAVEGVENLVAGDIVEVFDNFSWKIASVLKAVSREKYSVRVLGSSQEFCIQSSDIRVRKVWEDDKWTLLGKGCGGCGFLKTNKLSTSNYHQKVSFRVPKSGAVVRSQALKDCANAELDESRVVSSRSRKRISPPTKFARKMRAIEKDGQRERVIAASVLGKVDAGVYPRNILSKKYMHPSFNDGRIELDGENLVRDPGFGCAPSRSSAANGYDSDASSVGSCSITSRTPNNFPNRVADSFCSDAESSYGTVDEEERCHPFEKEMEMAENVHRLELHAYRRTLEALYASGPLSWEQEALLTNLRITLHISNDEHLMELKNLISSKSSNL